uniref:Clone 740 transcribed RNA sequence n=1 Tax=Plectreurys tristis TaxID=33319 RepID=A0A0C4W4D3_PLETR|nr:hypothetical protein [Plectreurys tristis]
MLLELLFCFLATAERKRESNVYFGFKVLICGFI